MGEQTGATALAAAFPDWSNPLTYILLITAISAGGTLLWKIAVWVTNVNRDRDNFGDFMKAVDEKLDKIILLVSGLAQENSPLQLTPKGQGVAKYMEAEKYLDEAVPKALQNDELLTLEDYEIERWCKTYVKEFLPEEWQKNLDRAAYQFGVDSGSVMAVLWILLRDRVLAEKRKKEELTGA